jgi:hypothetical protein
MIQIPKPLKYVTSGDSGSHGSDYTNTVMWHKDYAILTWASTFTC